MTVKFDNGKALDVNGTLVAQGTSSSKITFTSSAVSPAAGDWKFIRFNSSSTSATFDGSGNYLSGSILQYCTVEYAGAGSVPGQGIHIPAINSLYVSPFVDHCTIQHNESRGLYVWIPPAGVTIRITNNIFNDNTGAMYVRASAGSNLAANPIVVENNTVTTGTGTGIYVGSFSAVNGASVSVSNNSVSGNSAGIFASIGRGGTLTVSNNTIADNSGVGLTLYGNYFSNNTATSTSVIASNNTITGNGDSDGSTVIISNESCTSPIHFSITDNTILNNTGGLYFNSYYEDAGGYYNCNSWYNSGDPLHSLTLTNNNIIQNDGGRSHGTGPSATLEGAALYLITVGPATVTGNRIHNNGSSNAESIIWLESSRYADAKAAVAFKDNQISGNQATNTVRAYHSNGDGTYDIEQNSFHDNTTTNDFKTHEGGPSGIDLDNNWWGANSEAVAESRIFHWTDDITFPTVDFIPILTAPPVSAPPAPPINVAAQTGPTTIAFAWDANPESDITGYKIHYDTDAAGYPYATSTDMGNVTSYTLTGLNTGTTYYTAVAAYDSSGDESWVSTDATATTLNTQPTASDTNLTTSEDTSVQVTLTGSDPDGDSITFSIASQPPNGSLGPLTVVDASSATVVYTPSADFNGNDTFTYVTNDGHVDSAAATVTVSVSYSNDAPVAYSQTVSTSEGTPVTVTLTGSDVDGDNLTWAISDLVGGTSVFLPSTVTATTIDVIFTPHTGFVGTASISFYASDASVGSNTADITINVVALGAATPTPTPSPSATPVPGTTPTPTATPVPNVWDAPSTSQPGMIMLVIGMLGALLIFLTKSRSRIKADKGLSR